MTKLACGRVCALFLATLVGGCGGDAGDDVSGPSTTGSIRVTTSTTGDDLDPDGYTIILDGTQSQAMTINGSVTFSGLGEGSHSIQLSDVAVNCTVSGENPRTAIVAAGQTRGEDFGVTCAAALYDRVAFHSSRDGNAEIYIMNVDGSDPVRLTDDPAKDAHPTWSPDGTKIAFTSDRDGGGIYVMNANGSNPVRVTDGRDSHPTWSPDGTRIAFSSFRTGPSEVYVMNADGSDVVQLTSGGSNAYPTWSPDGTKIAFYTSRDGNPEIYVMDADGSNPVRLTDDPEWDIFPSWSPDGTRIAFTSWRDGEREIYVMNADGSNPVRLTNDPGNDQPWDIRPSWSPDGTKIAFTSYRDGNSEIYVINDDGSGVTRLTNNPAGDHDPVWSPTR
ncbi:MAG: PD40 domain-containing protein [Gemmatimonadota bacterium]|nr:MAG: PD40 domain-containing protein [Gemmatimonadota bacterium]